MIGSLARVLDNLLGRGEAAVTVPPLDGALRPNRKLDEATGRALLPEVDCLAAVGEVLVASAGNALFEFDGKAWKKRSEQEAEIACIAPAGGGLAVALLTGDVLIQGGAFDARRYRVADANCITALAASETDLFVANGSATVRASGWQRDLLERNASGSIWRVDLQSGGISQIAGGLAWPAGLAVDANGLVFSDAWKHQIARIDPARTGQPQVLLGDLPAYPGRIAPAADGWWLALFAPRSQLVEFVLRESAYRERMMSEVPDLYWIAPRLRSGRSFYESLQGGGVKHLGMLKPWAPTMSAGFCVKLDRAFQPRSSLQSRADGNTHGVTSIAQHQGQVFVAARGDGVIVSLPLDSSGADRGVLT